MCFYPLKSLSHRYIDNYKKKKKSINNDTFFSPEEKMKKFISLALLTYILIAVSVALPADNDKRAYCKCSCTVAKALFNDQTAGPIRGLTFFTQDECGKTTVSGLFHKGFNPKKKQTFKILDSCGRVIRDLTSDLNVQVRDDGGSEFFSHAFDFSLDCGHKGILFPPTKPCYTKRSDDGGAVFQITSNGDIGFADIE